MDKIEKDFLIIGGGAGGLCVASVVSQLGFSVALIEKQKSLGGDCLHYGCVPSKSLIKASKVAYHIRNGSDYGLFDNDKEFNWDKIKEYVKSKVDKIQIHDSIERFEKMGCEVFIGNGKFLSPYDFQINDKVIVAKKIVIATGSRPNVPSIDGIENTNVITNENIFSLKEQPKKLIVLGAGPIGLELSQALNRFGTQITILEKNPRILPFASEEISNSLYKILNAEGIDFNFNSKVIAIDEGKIRFQESNHTHEEKMDSVLFAVGRRPNVEHLDLEKAGVEYNSKGIIVNNKLKTSQSHIYAVGDVTDSKYKFTHISEYHAGIVISNAVFKFPKKIDYSAVPAVIFTDPEFAQVGMTKKELDENNVKYDIAEFKAESVDRAITDSSESGVGQIMIVKNKVVGANILAQNAGEYIHELALAINTKAKVNKISDTIHAYPTMSQINRRIVNNHLSKMLFNEKTKSIARWLFKWF